MVIADCGKIGAINRIHVGILVLVSGLLECQSDTPDAATTQRVIEESQAKSRYGAKPNWLKFRDVECASKPDEAIEASVIAIHFASAQSEMTNKDSLGAKERWVAMNPNIAPRVTKQCWALYEEHGAVDARILAVCLGNLTDYSPHIKLPAVH
jgi:hypothetical protein